MQRETHKHTQTETLEHTDIPEESKVRNHNIYGKCLYDKENLKILPNMALGAKNAQVVL